MFIFILMNKQRNRIQGMSRHTYYVRLDTFELLGGNWSSLYQFYHVTIMSWWLSFIEICGHWVGIICILAICEWRMLCLQVKREYFCDIAGGFEEGVLFRWQCNADRTEQCPELCVALTGNRRVRVKVIILVIIYCFFWVFCFLDQINTARGLNVRIAMRDDGEWGWRGFEVIPSE